MFEVDDDQTSARALLVETDEGYAASLQRAAVAAGARLRVEWVANQERAIERLARGSYDVVLLSLPPDLAEVLEGHGIAFLERLRDGFSHVPLVVLAEEAGHRLMLESIVAGARGFFVKEETDVRGILRTVEYMLDRRRLDGESDHARRLHEANENLRRIIRAAADGIIIVDNEGKILMANPAACVLFEKEAGTLIGEPFGCPVLAGESVEIDVKGHVAEMRAVQTVWEGRPAFVISLRDITQRKQVENALKEMTVALQRANKRLNELANEDPLTGLLNRRGMDAALSRELERSRRGGQSLTALLVDCDHFKRINDLLGHGAGDVVLKEVARRLASGMRPSDLLARIGGDEFLALLPDTRLAEGVVVAERLRLAVSSSPIVSSFAQRIETTVSVGVAPVGNEVTCVEEVLPVTHLALKKSKLGGKNQTSSTGEHAALDPDQDGDAALVADLERRLLQDRVFRVTYVPIVDLKTSEVIGREYCVKGPPGLYEQSGDLFRLCRDRDVLTLADLAALRCCSTAARSCRQPGQRFHFNVFPSTLLATDPASVVALLPLERGPCCLEISEQQVIGDPSHLRVAVMRLKQAGVQVALDEVAFGGTVLEGLIVLEPDIVKLDPRCVADAAAGLATDLERHRFEQVCRLVRLVGFAGAKIVGEGVETRPQLDAAISAGIAMGQGSLFEARERDST